MMFAFRSLSCLYSVKRRYILLSLIWGTGFLTQSAHAASIQHNGYVWSGGGSKVVTGGGLQWLRWNVTEASSESIETALLKYGGSSGLEGGGWQLASYQQVAELLGDFDFLGFNPSNTEFGGPAKRYYGSTVPDSIEAFHTLFGDTTSPGQTRLITSAFYGEDLNGDQKHNLVALQFYPEGTSSSRWRARIDQTQATYLSDQTRIEAGVALVRPAPVPLPAAAWLFITAIISLMGAKQLVVNKAL